MIFGKKIEIGVFLCLSVLPSSMRRTVEMLRPIQHRQADAALKETFFEKISKIK